MALKKKASSKVVAPKPAGFVPMINKGGTSKESPGAENDKSVVEPNKVK